MNHKIVIAEDDPGILTLLSIVLKRTGYVVKTSEDGSDAVNLIARETPDLAILDWNLPGLSGLQISRYMRSNAPTRGIPILMVTVYNQIDEVVTAFESGIDDYMTKPFDVREFSARVKALLRRPERDTQEIIEFGPIRIDVTDHNVQLEGTPLTLRPKEYELLLALVKSEGRLLSRETLMQKVWGYDSQSVTRTLDYHVAKLREKLAPGYSSLIQTVSGYGYRIVPPDTRKPKLK